MLKGFVPKTKAGKTADELKRNKQGKIVDKGRSDKGKNNVWAEATRLACAELKAKIVAAGKEVGNNTHHHRDHDPVSVVFLVFSWHDVIVT